MTDISDFDRRQAFDEGWRFSGLATPLVARHGHFGCDGQNINTYPEADARALAFVQQRAAEGSAYHIEALMLTQLT